MIAVSGDRPDRLAPGEPSLWRALRDRVDASSIGAARAPGTCGVEQESHHHRPVDMLLHAGGQSWMADAFDDAWELLKRRAMEPVLGADGGWREAQEAAAERLREVTGICNEIKHPMFCLLFGGETPSYEKYKGMDPCQRALWPRCCTQGYNEGSFVDSFQTAEHVHLQTDRQIISSSEAAAGLQH